MKKKLLLTACLMAVSLPLFSQIRLQGANQDMINPALFRDNWSARWIAAADEPTDEFGVYHFRKTFDLPSAPAKFVVHVSADQRYKLYVNGTIVSLGPARGDLDNWSFETVDIAPYLTSGRNVLAAVVWNYANLKPAAQISTGQTGFMLQGNGEAEAVVNSNNSWKAVRNNSYAPWREGRVSGYFVVGPGELVDARAYPWGWESKDFNDSAWKDAQETRGGVAMKGARSAVRQLVPSPIPQQELTYQRLSRLRRSEGVSAPAGFPAQKTAVTIPANTSVTMLLDQDVLTTGYFSLGFSKGRNAEIVISYAEALVEEGTRNSKGNRDDVEGKVFNGYEDKIIADGGDNRTVTSLWWRTWRYVELRIQTASEPLVIDDIYSTYTGYPFEQAYELTVASDRALNEKINKMLDIGWRTARLCAHESYMDCPYYEQLQYFGDARIQTMISIYNTKDDRLFRAALEHGRQSMGADGYTQSRYPSDPKQLIPSYSLCWLGMGYDFMMHNPDYDYVRTLLPAYRSVLAWYESFLKDDYSLDIIPHWYFVDWAPGFQGGTIPREPDGNSAFQDLKFIISLEEMAVMEEKAGVKGMAEYYRDLASKIKATIFDKYWDAERKLFADTRDRRSYSQHTNTYAILAGMVTGDDARELMIRTLEDETLIPATVYFNYYVMIALDKAGLGDQYLDRLGTWEEYMDLGLTTWAEQPEPSRSDCHAWGSSPNIFFFSILLGIQSDAPGFEKVLIAPSLGSVREISGTMPHSNGDISVSYTVDGNGRMRAEISLPQGVTGKFVWKGKEYALSGGSQIVTE